VLGSETHIASNELDALTRFAELPNRIITEAPAESAEDRSLTDAAGDCHERDVIAIELPRANFGKQLVVFTVEVNEAFELLSVFEQLGERRILGLWLIGRRFSRLGRTFGRGVFILLSATRVRFDGFFRRLGLAIFRFWFRFLS